jgi:hypothetical protein
MLTEEECLNCDHKTTHQFDYHVNWYGCEELQKIIPKDIKIKPYYEQSSFVGDAVKALQIVC